MLNDQSGQVLIWVAMAMTAMLAMAGLCIDVGHAYSVRNQLQDSANMAALAGAEALPNASTATVKTNANTYSSSSGDKNVYVNLGTVSTSVVPTCLSTLKALGLSCFGSAGSNSVKVTQSVSVPTFFLKVVGVPTMQVSATATAARAKPIPYNVAIIVDTTLSMNDQDSDCGNTQLACAMNGVEILLNSLTPSVDQVSLFTFPNVTSTTVSKDYTCSSSSGRGQHQSQSATAGVYTVPSKGATSYTPGTNPTYQIVGFSNDYRTSDAATSLNPNSDLVLAAGQLASDGTTTSVSGCLAPPSNAGNYGTYLAGVIYAAQAALTAEHTVYPVQNVIVLLSDGNSNASNVYSSGYGSGRLTMFDSGVTATGTYPSYVGDCGQEVSAANYAVSQGTAVYTIAYGAQTVGQWIAGNINGSNCPTDQDGFFTTYGLGSNVSTSPNISPCQALKNMASPPDSTGTQYFYSDYNQSGSNSQCYSSNSESPTSLSGIFAAIGSGMSGVRLIPNSAP